MNVNSDIIKEIPDVKVLQRHGSNNVKDTETKDRFVELRSDGLSFSAIAKKLKVSKQTLINWSKEFQDEIANLKAIELEALRDENLLTEKGSVESIGVLLKKITGELEKRNLSDVPTGTLINMFVKIQAVLVEKEKKPVVFCKNERQIF